MLFNLHTRKLLGDIITMKGVGSDTYQIEEKKQTFDFDERAIECKFLTLEEAEQRNAETQRLREEAERMHPKPKRDEYDPSVHKPRERLPRDSASISEPNNNVISPFEAGGNTSENVSKKRVRGRSKGWTVPREGKIQIPGRRPINLELTTWVPAY